MIDRYVSIVRDSLYKYLSDSCRYNGQVIIVNNHELTSGGANYTGNILMNVASICVKDDLNNNMPQYVRNGSNYIVKKSPVNVYVYVFFHSYFFGDNALEGIKFLSHTIGFFKEHCHFSSMQFPKMVEFGIGDFNVTLENDHDEIFTHLGIPYIPSVLYKIGLIPITSETPNIETVPSIKRI